MATFTPIQGQPGFFDKHEVVDQTALDSDIAGWQKRMDDAQSAIDDYLQRVQVSQNDLAVAKQNRDAIIAVKTQQVVVP